MATFPEIAEAYGDEATMELLVGIDKNANEVVCWLAHPEQSRVTETKTYVANIVDDVAGPR